MRVMQLFYKIVKYAKNYGVVNFADFLIIFYY